MGQLPEHNITIVILLGSIIMLLLVGSMVLFVLLYQKRAMKEKQLRTDQELVFQNQMINAKLETEEQERKRIASDLHDSLGSLLFGAKVNSTFIHRTVPMTGEAVESFKELNEILDESISVVRKIAWELTPEALQYSGLIESVKKVCERLNGKGIQILIQEENGVLWNDEKALQMFRVIQELISNTLKHSSASILEIKMKWVLNEFQLTVRDNGVGITNLDDKKGVGLWNIHHRVTQLKGEINIGHPPMGSGLEVSIKIPLVS